MIAAVVFLAEYAVPILNPNLPSWPRDLCHSLSWITWGIFVVDKRTASHLRPRRPLDDRLPFSGGPECGVQVP